jgi:3-methyl-2-oxobutanoate hydroxymethyltransferase
VRFLTDRGIPVCGHLGLTPQTVHALGGWRVQGREAQEASTLLQHARELRDAGASMLVLELVPSLLAGQVTRALDIPVIGIGAGPRCSGQVLVLHDILGLQSIRTPRFVHNFMEEAGTLDKAVAAYVRAVKSGRYPEEGVHTY